MNIDTDMQFAYSHEIGAYVTAHAKAFDFQIDPEDGTPYKNSMIHERIFEKEKKELLHD